MFHKKEKELPIFVGFYGPSVLLTYLGVISGSLGIYFSFHHKITFALVCLIIAGICDAFDGKVARACKRTNKEKEFGIQLDSLADMVSFVFLPVAIAYSMGLDHWYHVIIYAMYMLAGVIRLAYFNVMAEEKGKDGPVTYYSGLPVTSAAIIFPLVYLLKYFVSPMQFLNTYSIIMAFVALLFVLNFGLKKPKTSWLYFFLVAGLILAAVLLIFYKGAF